MKVLIHVAGIEPPKGSIPEGLAKNGIFISEVVTERNNAQVAEAWARETGLPLTVFVEKEEEDRETKVEKMLDYVESVLFLVKGVATKASVDLFNKASEKKKGRVYSYTPS
jgi:hypothetical protein